MISSLKLLCPPPDYPGVLFDNEKDR